MVSRIMQLSKSEGIKSISDFIGARYGKSFTVAALVSAITSIGLIPYIALQLTAIRQLIYVYHGHVEEEVVHHQLIVDAVQLAIVFYTAYIAARAAHFKDQYDGVISALAVATTIKITVFVFVGTAALAFLFGTPVETLAEVMAQRQAIPALNGGASFENLVALILIGAASALLFTEPVLFDHCGEPGRKRTAACALAHPVGPARRQHVRHSVRGHRIGDAAQQYRIRFLLCQPAHGGRKRMAGHHRPFRRHSRGEGMIVAPSILLSIIITNDLLLPLVLRRAAGRTDSPKDFTMLIPRLRHWSLLAIMLVAWAYQYVVSWKMDFATLALISAVAVMQLFPPFVGALLWRGGTARGANLGMIAGFTVWLYTMVLPTFVGPSILDHPPWSARHCRAEAPGALRLRGGRRCQCVVLEPQREHPVFCRRITVAQPNATRTHSGLDIHC